MKVLQFLPVLIAGTFAQTSLPNLMRQPITQRDKTCEEKYCNYACLAEIFLEYNCLRENAKVCQERCGKSMMKDNRYPLEQDQYSARPSSTLIALATPNRGGSNKIRNAARELPPKGIECQRLTKCPEGQTCQWPPGTRVMTNPPGECKLATKRPPGAQSCGTRGSPPCPEGTKCYYPPESPIHLIADLPGYCNPNAPTTAPIPYLH